MEFAKFAILLLALSAVNSNKWDLSEDDNIPFLTKDTFDAFIQKHPVVFVMFYAPWCNHCKKIMPEFQRLVKRMENEVDDIPVVKVDCALNADLSSKYKIESFPTLKLLKDGEEYDFKGFRLEHDMHTFIMRHIQGIVKKLDTEKDLQIFSRNSLAALYILPEGDESALENFKQAAEIVFDMLFAYTHNADYAKSLGLSDKYNIVLVRDFDDGNKTTSASVPFGTEAIKNFIDANRDPTLLELTQDMASKIFAERRPMFVLFTDDFNIPAVQDLKTVASEFRGQFYFTLSKITDNFGLKLSTMGDVARGPTIRILQLTPIGIVRYIIENLHIDGMVQGINDFRSGSLMPSFKSEIAAPEQTTPVKPIVGSTFHNEVIANDKFVFLEGYAPWCHHCTKFEPIFEEVASRLAGHKDIVIAKMDATKNEFPAFVVKGYPTLALYKPGDKNQAVYYRGEPKVESLIKFMEEHTGRKLLDDGSQKNSEL